MVDALPDVAVESFAGVANPFALRTPAAGERVVDVGSGAGFDSFVAAGHVGPDGSVVGVDMTAEMLAKSRATCGMLSLSHVEFRKGLAEDLPVADGWADTVISNGVINLCADKWAAFAEIFRVLRKTEGRGEGPGVPNPHLDAFSAPRHPTSWSRQPTGIARECST